MEKSDKTTRVAVFDHIGNPGGGSRVVRSLLPAIKAIRPDWEIDFYGKESSIKRERLREHFSLAGIQIFSLKSTRTIWAALSPTKLGERLSQAICSKIPKNWRFLPSFLSGNIEAEISRISKNYDLAFFPWPYLLDCPDTTCPIVGIFHDFNYKYYFSGQFTYSKDSAARIEEDMKHWMSKAHPIVSTHFIKQELNKFYPLAKNKASVIHLGSLSLVSEIPLEKARFVASEAGAPDQYILYPTNICAHKNIGVLIAAIPELEKLGHSINLVLTGPGTERINGRATQTGVELSAPNQNVFGLGYVTNSQMDSLIQSAKAVVSTSLYEAGNGPGIDAWGRGVAVAMSNIPAFMEHITEFGLQAQVFDPRDPKDIAEKISEILLHPELHKKTAERSKQVMLSITWESVAKKYVAVFEQLLNHKEQ